MKEILKKIKPSQKEVEELNLITNKILNKLNKQLNKIHAEAIVGGSLVKNTWLKGNNEIDIFVKFNYEKYKHSLFLSNILEKQLAFIFQKVKRLHGSRDYFQIKRNNFTFEFIPILDIKKSTQALNITDISPLHVEWVKKNTDEKLSDEIRLAKYYCKCLGIYGAESYIKGFSGYVLEILTIHYKSFKNLVENTKKWKLKQIIDPKKYYKNEEQVFKTLSSSKTYSPLILIDPVQKDRNAAAALSLDTFTKFIAACKSFSLKQFEEKEFNLKEIKKQAKKSNTKLILLKIKTLGKEDIVGAKLLSLFNFIKEKIELNDFRLYSADWHWNKEDKAFFYFLIYKDVLPNLKKHCGPPIWEHEHSKSFIEKHKDKNIDIENSRLFVEVKRKYTKIESFLKDLIKTLPKNKYLEII